MLAERLREEVESFDEGAFEGNGVVFRKGKETLDRIYEGLISLVNFYKMALQSIR